MVAAKVGARTYESVPLYTDFL